MILIFNPFNPFINNINGDFIIINPKNHFN